MPKSVYDIIGYFDMKHQNLLMEPISYLDADNYDLCTNVKEFSASFILTKFGPNPFSGY